MPFRGSVFLRSSPSSRASPRLIQTAAARMKQAMMRWIASRYWLTLMRFTSPLVTIHQPMAPCRPPSAKSPSRRGTSRRSILPVSKSTTNGTKNTTPTRRPSRRWPHSHQKICLNSPTVMPLLTISYCGICWYLANSSCHSTSPIGGMTPWIGFHSVIERPEPVRRVAPPTTIMAMTIRITAPSQMRISARSRCLSRTGARCAVPFAAKPSIAIAHLKSSRRLDLAARRGADNRGGGRRTNRPRDIRSRNVMPCGMPSRALRFVGERAMPSPHNHERRDMPIRLRKFIGMIALVVLVIVYAFVAMVIAQLKLPEAPRWVQMLYYVIVGLAWIFPAGAIIAWMQKPTAPKN